MAGEGWQRTFEDPITLPDGRTLKTLRDAAAYIEALPKREAAQKHWQTAIAELINAADRGGIRMMAQIAMGQALHHGKELQRPPRKKPARQYRIIR